MEARLAEALRTTIPDLGHLPAGVHYPGSSPMH
jgi:hypothetical protein